MSCRFTPCFKAESYGVQSPPKINLTTQHSTQAANIKLQQPTFNFSFQHSKLKIKLKLPTSNMITSS